MNKIYLWENPPYIADTDDNFRPSITEFKVNDTNTAVIEGRKLSSVSAI